MLIAKPDLTIDCLVHDLNNVFQTIIDAADLVSSDPDWHPIASIILRSVEQGRLIVSSLAEQDQNAISFDLLAEHAMAFAQDHVTSVKGPTLLFAPDIPGGIYPNLKSSALERVLVNLFINAAQAAHRAGREECRIRVSAHARSTDVQIIVSDDGPGIPAEVLPSVFSAGFSTGQNHAGLGLHIVYSLVTGAGGTVAVSNGEHNGAIFSLTIPAVRRVAATAG